MDSAQDRAVAAPDDAALSALSAREAPMLDLLRRLVSVNSFTGNVAGVNAVGALLREAFQLPSLDIEVVEGGSGYGDHLIWKTRAAGPPIVLIGHHDTVFPPGYFERWTVEGGRAIGPGVLDMKGGLCVLWAALATLEQLGLLASLPVTLVSVADEEVGSPDSRPHLERLSRGASCALVFESGRPNDAIVTRRRGTGTLTFTFEGRAAHAGNAHATGVNAIWAMSRFIDRAQALTDYGRGITVNVGKVAGGTSSNTVPARAECVVDVRFEQTRDVELLLRDLRSAASEVATAAGGRVTVSGGMNRPPFERTTASAALMAEYATCARAAGLGDGEMPIVGGGSDANTVGALGVPAIDGLGPRGDGFHSTSEWVDLSSFVPKAEALLRFAWRRLPG
jgi:glutamate carboxypeptidase